MKIVDQGRDHAVALFRIVLGFLFVCHGIKLIFGVFGGKAVAFGAWPTWWASIIQLVGGTAVALGIGTRIIALVCSGSMAFAYFTVHAPGGLLPIENGGEAAVFFCWGFLLIAVIGGGSWALSSAFQRPAVAERSPAGMETAS
jgi:putative oxidoreductase